MAAADPVRFAVIGLEHPHVYAVTGALVAAGAELVAVHSANDAAAKAFGRMFPQAARVDDESGVLADESIEVIVPVGVPADRAGVAVRAMEHGKDVLADKPAVTTADQLAHVRRVRAETGRIFAVYFSERLESRATVRALDLVEAGAVGDVVQVVGFGPHRLGLETRPDWFFDPSLAGGILCDLATHQMDQFLHFAGADVAELVTSSVANRAHPDHPDLEDYGDVVLRTPTVDGYARVDWFTPAGLDTWGDGRLFVMGTEGSIEVRKYTDLGGRPGGDHLLLVDGDDVRRFDCQQVPLPFAGRFLADVRDRTETALSQQRCLAACELALAAQAGAVRRGHLAGER